MTPEQELCAKAADLIEDRGLNQDGRYYSESHGCWCTLGALAHAYDGRNQPLDFDRDEKSLWENAVFCGAMNLVSDAIDLNGTYYTIPTWNDEVATAEQVVDVLRQAASGSHG